MSYTLYDASIGLSRDIFTALTNVISKAKECPSPDKIPNDRIFEDMYPFTYQIHRCTMVASKMASRIEGKEIIDYQDNLTDFASMEARVAEVREQLDAVSKEAVNSRIDEIVDVGMGPGNLDAKITAWQYVHGYGVPNMYFHLVTAYNIVRKEGGSIGKLDFLLPFVLPFVANQIPKEMSERLGF